MNNSSDIQWLLFDLDNTLLDFSKSSAKAFEHLLNEVAPELDATEMYPRYKRFNNKLWEDREQGLISHEDLKVRRWQLFFEDQGIPFNPSSANDIYFEVIRNRVDFVAHAEELLDDLAGRYRMAIITNGLSEVQRPRLEKSGIMDRFEHIIISDEIGSAKPQQAFFEYTHDKINAPTQSDVLVIGDTLKSDIKGGNEFGYRTCWFNHDYLDHDGAHFPDHEVNLLKELVPVIGL